MMTLRSPILLIPLALFVAVGLNWVQAQTTSPADADLSLIVLGPAGEWLYPRSIEVSDEEAAGLLDSYVAAVRDLEDHLPSPTLVAAGWFTPPSARAETLYGQPQRWLADLGVDVALPSAQDMALGSEHLNAVAASLACPLLATNVDLQRTSEPSRLAASIPLPADGEPRAHLMALIDPLAITVTGGLGEESVDSPERLDVAVAGAGGLPVLVLDAHPSLDPPAGAVALEIPELRSSQAGVYRLGELASGNPSVSLEIINLVPGDASPLLGQPAAARLTVAEPIHPTILSALIRREYPFDEYSEAQRALSTVEGLPEGVSNTVAHVYELFSGGEATHRAFQVSADPGGDYPGATVVVLTNLSSGEVSLFWPLEITLGHRITTLPALVNSLVAEHGLDGLPAQPDAAAGALITYGAIREALAAAAVFQRSLEDLP